MRRALAGGFELDDEHSRIDVAAVHAYISGESYWGRGRSREFVERALAGSARVVGLYRGGQQVGFARAVSDEVTVAYMADVYVLEPHRGLGLGVELVRELVEAGPLAELSWMLHTRDAQGLYARLGFREGAIHYAMMERRRGAHPGAQGDIR
jgi:ribosomal protein S18 acetylase RimI-like enzyme